MLEAFPGLVRLFGSDRAFFQAAAFGAGTGMSIDATKRAGYLEDFRAAMLFAALAVALPARASGWEARRECLEGQREITCERREMRREVHRELRHGRWNRHRDRTGEIIAGVALGAIIVSVARGVAPPPPSPELCWAWTDACRERGCWDRCGGC